MHKKFKLFPILLLLFVIFLSISTNCDNSTEPKDQDTIPDTTTIRKPNIYIYPDVKRQLNVTLSFPQGGYVTISEPEYQNGWNIMVEPSGLIDNKYDFLFYECKVPDAWQYKYGWIVNNNKLEEFFLNNLESYGFIGIETEDFLDYWISILSDFENLIIFPQVDFEIEQLITLRLSKQPDNIRRLFYIIYEYLPSMEKPLTPSIPSFIREGFCVVEWGVILK